MNIALVTETFPPEINGVAMTLKRLVHGLAALGDDVTVVRPRQRADRGAPVHREADGERPYAEWLVPGIPLPKYADLMLGLPVHGRLWRRWQADRPDVVHVPTEGPLGWSALAAAAKLGIPVSSSFHTNFHQYGDHYGYGFGKELAVGYLRSLHNQTALTLVPTHQMQLELQRDGFRNVEVLSRGVDGMLFSPARRSEELRREWGAGPEEPVFVYVGRLAREKNIDLAVESFLAVREHFPRAHLVLVGDGPERPALQRRYPEFHFAGMRRGEDLAAHYASGDVFVFPSVTETFGNVVTEALASGLVVVTYDYAAGREHIRSGRNGILARFDDPVAFRAATLEAARCRDEWPRLRAAARETTVEITWDSIIGRFRGLLASVATLGVAENLLG